MGKEILKMEHITKIYPNGVMANRDVSFSVREGEIHALMGENGAGKSTLMKILFGDEDATEGDIIFEGNKIQPKSAADTIRLGIGMVHQHFMLVDSLRVYENVILGMEPKNGIMIDQGKSDPGGGGNRQKVQLKDRSDGCRWRALRQPETEGRDLKSPAPRGETPDLR